MNTQVPRERMSDSQRATTLRVRMLTSSPLGWAACLQPTEWPGSPPPVESPHMKSPHPMAPWDRSCPWDHSRRWDRHRPSMRRNPGYRRRPWSQAAARFQVELGLRAERGSIWVVSPESTSIPTIAGTCPTNAEQLMPLRAASLANNEWLVVRVPFAAQGAGQKLRKGSKRSSNNRALRDHVSTVVHAQIVGAEKGPNRGRLAVDLGLLWGLSAPGLRSVWGMPGSELPEVQTRPRLGATLRCSIDVPREASFHLSKWPQLGRDRVAEVEPTLTVVGSSLAEFGQNRGPVSVDAGPNLTEFGPILVKAGLSLAGSGPTLVESTGLRAKYVSDTTSQRYGGPGPTLVQVPGQKAPHTHSVSLGQKVCECARGPKRPMCRPRFGLTPLAEVVKIRTAVGPMPTSAPGVGPIWANTGRRLANLCEAPAGGAADTLRLRGPTSPRTYKVEAPNPPASAAWLRPLFWHPQQAGWSRLPRKHGCAPQPPQPGCNGQRPPEDRHILCGPRHGTRFAGVRERILAWVRMWGYRAGGGQRPIWGGNGFPEKHCAGWLSGGSEPRPGFATPPPPGGPGPWAGQAEFAD